MIRATECYYFILHAYHHVVGVVESVDGPSRCTLAPAFRVQSSARGWAATLAEGLQQDDLVRFPDQTEICGWVLAMPWPHPLPDGG